MLPIVSLPNTTNQLDTSLLLPGGKIISGAEYAKMYPDLDAKIMTHKSEHTAANPEITYSDYKGKTVVSVAFMVDKDETGRGISASILLFIDELNKISEVPSEVRGVKPNDLQTVKDFVLKRKQDIIDGARRTPDEGKKKALIMAGISIGLSISLWIAYQNL